MTSRQNALALHILFFAYALCPFSAWKDMLWQLIKLELFYIGGACKKTGNCCEGIVLTVEGHLIETIEAFENARKKHAELTCFEPAGVGSVFNCRNLKPDRTCADYANRPQLCRAYPANHFFSGNRFYDDCGFRVIPKAWHTLISSHRGLHRRVQDFAATYDVVWRGN